MADDEDKKTDTPPVETPPTAPVETPPVTQPDPPADDNDLRDMVKGLAEQVASLASTVTALAPLPNDEAPVSAPWTHKKVLS